MIKILANDGIDKSGKDLLEAAGFTVDTQNIPQDQLVDRLNEYDAILVRSATKVRQELIDACPNLKLIGRGGVGMDNIDVQYARDKGLTVVNTPGASSISVAELVFSHLFSLARNLHLANREMPEKGVSEFGKLKKQYSKGFELRGKTMGIIGFGRIGQEVARMAIGLGMDVYAYNLTPYTAEITFDFPPHITNASFKVPINATTKEEVLKASDFVTLHIPHAGGKAVIGKEEIAMMKDNAVLINCARGGVVDEDALLEALESGKLHSAGLDVFDNEPTPREALVNNPKISSTPHIGAATEEAQERVGIELAEQIIDTFKKLELV